MSVWQLVHTRYSQNLCTKKLVLIYKPQMCTLYLVMIDIILK